MTFEEYRDSVKKVTGKRTPKLNKTWTTRDIYKYIRKHGWEGVSRKVSESEYYAIVRTLNEELANRLERGQEIRLPYKLGTLELRKEPPRIQFKDGKLKTDMSIDWDSTLRLWYEDEEAKLNKTLIYNEAKEIFRVKYNKSNAEFTNRSFYFFRPTRDLKLRLKKAIIDNKIDAYKLW